VELVDGRIDRTKTVRRRRRRRKSKAGNEPHCRYKMPKYTTPVPLLHF
jgi:hypothetical protein